MAQDDTSAWTVVPEPAPAQTGQSPSAWWQQHQTALAVTKGALNTIPGAAAIAGGVIAAPESAGALSLPGAALGAAAGRGARDTLAEWLGIESPTSPLSKSARMAIDAALTVAIPALAQGAKNVLSAPKATLADVLDATAHPQKAADSLISYLRSSSTPSAALPLSKFTNYPRLVTPELGEGTITEMLLRGKK